MKLTKEDIDTITDEIKQMIRCEKVEHVRNALFNITADFWTESDFSNARDVGLSVQGVMATYLGKLKVDSMEVPKYGIEVEVEYIGKHRIVMG